MLGKVWVVVSNRDLSIAVEVSRDRIDPSPLVARRHLPVMKDLSVI